MHSEGSSPSLFTASESSKCDYLLAPMGRWRLNLGQLETGTATHLEIRGFFQWPSCQGALFWVALPSLCMFGRATNDKRHSSIFFERVAWRTTFVHTQHNSVSTSRTASRSLREITARSVDKQERSQLSQALLQYVAEVIDGVCHSLI
jgi:hypothetical protein